MKIFKPYIGRYVIIRTDRAGVHYGRLEEVEDEFCILSDTRRMRYFECLDDGDSLSHIALNGISPNSKITAAIEAIILQWIEIIPVTDNAKLTFDAQPYEKVK